MLTRKSYLPYGEPLETELEPQSKGYIGKEKDKENNLGDHGVRKYDSQIGRFTSTEPLYEKYFGWSPYQYSFNNPVNFSDWNGLNPGVLGYSIVVGGGLTNSEGMVLVGMVFGIPSLVYYGEDIKNSIYELEASLNPPKENPATLNPMAQDATATNVNLMNAEQKLDRQMAMQNKKLPSDNIPNNTDKNEEADAILKAALAKEG